MHVNDLFEEHWELESCAVFSTDEAGDDDSNVSAADAQNVQEDETKLYQHHYRPACTQTNSSKNTGSPKTTSAHLEWLAVKSPIGGRRPNAQSVIRLFFVYMLTRSATSMFSKEHYIAPFKLLLGQHCLGLCRMGRNAVHACRNGWYARTRLRD